MGPLLGYKPATSLQRSAMKVSGFLIICLMFSGLVRPRYTAVAMEGKAIKSEISLFVLSAFITWKVALVTAEIE